ncbi:MAG TPA: response regulator [Coleofasciculaceae cyanobacterium]|jgi:DNA-binding response OmpR family regulator
MSDFQVILFVGKPQETDLEEWSADFQEDGMLTCLFSETLGNADEAIWPLVTEMWPDLICVFADDLEAQGEDVMGFCTRMREQMLKYRPILVVHSGGSEDQRIQYLIQGADDILRADLSPEEFKIRLLAHLRRNLDVTANDITRLPGLHFTGKVAQRRLNQGRAAAMILIELDHFDVYTEVYGDLAARQLMKTFAAVLSQLVMVPDFISHTEENHFVVVTHPDKAEKIAALLCRQFETVSPNFYSEKDRKQGYMISVLSDNISRRVPLVSLSMGIVSTATQPFDTFTSLFTAALQMKELAKLSPGCGWQSDRLRLSGAQAEARQEKPGILVLETDAALAYLLKTTLEMEGYEVDVASGVEDARLILTERMPERGLNMVILDALINEQQTGLALAGEIHADHPEISIICTSSLHNRQQVLQAGADLYLPKPFELSSLFFWIQRLLQEGR